MTSHTTLSIKPRTKRTRKKGTYWSGAKHKFARRDNCRGITHRESDGLSDGATPFNREAITGRIRGGVQLDREAIQPNSDTPTPDVRFRVYTSQSEYFNKGLAGIAATKQKEQSDRQAEAIYASSTSSTDARRLTGRMPRPVYV